MIKKVVALINNMKEKRPLVECLTNKVTINDCANMLLAMGASPIMAEIECEMEEIMSISSALVINLGLLDEHYLSSMRAAAKAAKEQGKPIVIDPVGAGASSFRDRVCSEMIEAVKPDIIRGNMSEIRSLSGSAVSSKGVDASDSDLVTEENKEEFGKLILGYAKKVDAVVCATSAIDVVSDGSVVYYLKNGHEMLCDVTGTGCMCSAMTGAMAASGDALTAAVASVLMLSIAGEYAEEYTTNSGQGIGTFRTKLFDYVYNMTEIDLINRSRISTK